MYLEVGSNAFMVQPNDQCDCYVQSQKGLAANKAQDWEHNKCLHSDKCLLSRPNSLRAILERLGSQKAALPGILSRQA
jgi:hypothetical protein